MRHKSTWKCRTLMNSEYNCTWFAIDFSQEQSRLTSFFHWSKLSYCWPTKKQRNDICNSPSTSYNKLSHQNSERFLPNKFILFILVNYMWTKTNYLTRELHHNSMTRELHHNSMTRELHHNSLTRELHHNSRDFIWGKKVVKSAGHFSCVLRENWSYSYTSVIKSHFTSLNHCSSSLSFYPRRHREARLQSPLLTCQLVSLVMSFSRTGLVSRAHIVMEAASDEENLKCIPVGCYTQWWQLERHRINPASCGAWQHAVLKRLKQYNIRTWREATAAATARTMQQTVHSDISIIAKEKEDLVIISRLDVTVTTYLSIWL